MRLTASQQQTILATTRQLIGPEARVYLFGSRLDDQTKGGDIDLLVDAPMALSLRQRACLQLELETRLNLPVDIVACSPETAPTPFQQIARSRAMPLVQSS
ncbi:nucleotidyltransferase domain-containing protein [Candidatus Woesearchaeota archaeon]|jgi:predicted nucleotidyltransferase|nr:nucleotidyltransferase domain-containing protein [Candidatus Woesearchaeota archaeon]